MTRQQRDPEKVPFMQHGHNAGDDDGGFWVIVVLAFWALLFWLTS